MRDSFEAKILARPDDMDTWRVYADWLMDAGDPRGTLIDLEHQLATRPMPPAQRAELRARAEALRRPIEERWTAGAPGGMRLQWKYGYVVGATLYSWWGEREELDFLESLAQDPVGRFLTRLRIRSHCGLAALETLAAWPVLAQLHELVLADIGMSWRHSYDGVLGYHGLDLLAASPYLGNLRILDVSGNLIGVPTREPSSRSSSGNPFRPVVELTENKGEVLARFRGLTELRLRGCELGDAGVVALVGPDGPPGLASIDLTDNELGPDAIRALQSSPRLRQPQAPAGELGPLADLPLQGVFYFRAHDRYPGGNADMRTIKVTLLREPGGEPTLRAATYSNWDGSHYRSAEAPLDLDPSPHLPQVLAAAQRLIEAGATESSFTIFDGRLDSDEYDTEWSSLEFTLSRPGDGQPLLHLCVDAVYGDRRGLAPSHDPPDAVSQAFVDGVMRMCGIGRVEEHSNGRDAFSRTSRGPSEELATRGYDEMPRYL
jgi:uncharacterized protein (TIGR02996 family)